MSEGRENSGIVKTYRPYSDGYSIRFLTWRNEHDTTPERVGFGVVEPSEKICWAKLDVLMAEIRR